MSAASLAELDGALAGSAPLPRANGELVFEEPWQGRALGMGVVVLERAGVHWAEWRRHLAAAIVRHGQPPGETPATAYYTAWLDALESLLAARGMAAQSTGDEPGPGPPSR